LFRALYQKFDLISAQDAQSAAAVTELSQRQDIQIGGSLKPHCPPLAYKAAAQQEFLEQVGQRPIWLAASCHAADEDIALQVQRQLVEEGGSQLLILAPRFPDRRDEILAKLAGLPHAQRSRGEAPNAQTQVYLADTFSEMGLWYACSAHALIGGSFCDVEGHNPWEALQLGCSVMHGPRWLILLPIMPPSTPHKRPIQPRGPKISMPRFRHPQHMDLPDLSAYKHNIGRS